MNQCVASDVFADELNICCCGWVGHWSTACQPCQQLWVSAGHHPTISAQPPPPAVAQHPTSLHRKRPLLSPPQLGPGGGWLCGANGSSPPHTLF
jgi:hypothetical protein